MYVRSRASALKVTGSTEIASISQCSRYKIPKLITFYLMNVLLFYVQEHRYSGETCERNDMVKKATLGAGC